MAILLNYCGANLAKYLKQQVKCIFYRTHIYFKITHIYLSINYNLYIVPKFNPIENLH
jgi:hypothetical protein